MKTIINFLQD